MHFASDNTAPAHPKILEALLRANEGFEPSYGADALTARVRRRFCEIFEREVAVFFTPTGTAANALALAHFAPPGSLILCGAEAHAYIDEGGAAEIVSGGAKMLPLPAPGGKIAPAAVSEALRTFDGRMPASVLTLTQASECGTVYGMDEVRAVVEAARAARMKVHMDGARLANALAASGASPTHMTAGVDVLSFGGTKNGCVGAEAVVFFNPKDARGFEERRRRAGACVSKMRFVAAQFEAYLEGDLWLKLASAANASAQSLAEGLADVPGITIVYPPQANEVFVTLPEGAKERLRVSGAEFLNWVTPADPAQGRMIRLVCSWATTAGEIGDFVRVVRG